MSDYTEGFQCNDCGETWTWVLTGDTQCPFCLSNNTQPIEDEEEGK